MQGAFFLRVCAFIFSGIRSHGDISVRYVTNDGTEPAQREFVHRLIDWSQRTPLSSVATMSGGWFWLI